MKTIVLALGLFGFASQGFPQATHAPTWRGWATCEVTVTGPGYRDQQTHKWTTTGGAPAKRGAFDLYPGTWSVTGGGSLERTQGSQTLRVEWKRNVAGMSAPISVMVRASDGAILIGAGHAQLRAANAVTGMQEVRIDGKVTSRAPIGLEAFEYAFPSGRAAAKSKHVSGQKSESPSGSLGPMQPAGSTVQVTCLWDFQRGGVAAPRGTALPQEAASIAPKGCDQSLSDLSAAYQAAKSTIEVEYTQRIQQNDSKRAQLDGQLAALTAANNASPNESAPARMNALQGQIRTLETERMKMEDNRRNQLAEAQREADRAHAQCEAVNAAH